LRLLGGRGGEETSLHLGPRRVIGGLREISHKGLEPRAGLRGANSLRGVPGRPRISGPFELYRRRGSA
jgi:hypothetical protein